MVTTRGERLILIHPDREGLWAVDTYDGRREWIANSVGLTKVEALERTPKLRQL